MPENVTVQFQGGMNRRTDGPAQMPYELHNAKLGKHGGVRAYRAPEVMEDPDVNQDPNIPDEPGGEKPWIRWNDTWLSRFAQNFTDADSEKVEILQGHDQHNGNLYVTGTESRRLSGDSEISPHTFRLDKDATSFDRSNLTGPAAIKNVTFGGSTGRANKGIVAGNTVSYVFVPVDGEESAGPWVYYPAAPATINEDSPSKRGHQITIEVNEQCKYVEVYRTREWANMVADLSGGDGDGPRGGTIGRGTAPSDEDEPPYGAPPDLSYYFLDQISARSENMVDFVDSAEWKHEFESDDEADKYLPTDTLDRKINAWSYGSVSYSSNANSEFAIDMTLGDVVHAGAEAVRMVGRDRMMYGNPQWPLKPPQIAMAVRNIGATTQLQLAFEYQIDSVGKVFGPLTDTNVSLDSVNVPWQGEQALHIWDDSATTHLDRVIVSATGLYPTSSKSQDLRSGDRDRGGDRNSSRGDPSDDPDTGLGAYSDQNSQKWVQEPNVVLLSERFRPLEITFEDQYEVPEGENIHAFSAARLSEEESIANYSFYIFTDQGVHTGNLTQDEAKTYPVNTVGIKQNSVSPDNSPKYKYALYEVTKYGTAYMGTDNRLYHLRGRQFEALDEPVPNIWYSDLGEPQFANVEYQAIYNEYSDVWSQVGGFSGEKTLTPFDISYDQQRDQIMIATLDNVWIFDFEQQGWVGNYFASGVQNLQYIGELDDPNTADHRAVMVHRNPGSSAEYLLLNEDGDPITDNAVVTNPLLRTANESKVREVTLDYDPLSKDADVSLTDGSTTVNVESGDSFDTSSPSLDKMATVFVPDGEDGGSKNLTGVIESITDDSTADMTEPAGVNASSTSPIPLRWFPPAIVRQEPTGDYYSTRDVNDDQVRRSEIAYKAHPRRTRYPRANGSGHIMRIEKFRNFKSMQLMVDKSDL